ncbi:fimbria adhesin protein-like [Bactrocera neohumeralis]|uniref:fimbria adhesin protein-like n=1 Tax=Bactrocera neohumeralis TaxID=98809 RepID=UPI0021664D5A|nr:fimbria adhesin protein-like [Bactrocera neohumeralis]
MDVNMGEISKNKFNGIGSTGGDRNFNIELQCNGGTTLVGYANINMSFSGKVPGTLSNNSGVLENESAGNSKAKGVGIQVMKDSQPIKFNSNYKVGTVQSDETRFITVPLQAKFYQYEKSISAGQVESHMVFNLNYD